MSTTFTANGRTFQRICELQENLDGRLEWYNHARINGGKVNQGLPPYVVAFQCAGLDEDQREARLVELRKWQKQNNRSAWEVVNDGQG